jgi:hypothetical protein
VGAVFGSVAGPARSLDCVSGVLPADGYWLAEHEVADRRLDGQHRGEVGRGGAWAWGGDHQVGREVRETERGRPGETERGRPGFGSE